MKYHSISLKNDKSVGFLKYKSKYESLLDECNISDKIKKVIKFYSELMSLASNHQSYMITNIDSQCIGGIVIDENSLDNEMIMVEIELDKAKFESEDAIDTLLNKIIESLKIFYYDKKKLNIKFRQKNISHNKYNQSEKYSDYTYYFNNEQNSLIMKSLVKEIIETKDSNVNWEYQVIDANGNQYLYDGFFNREMMNDLCHSKYKIEDAFYWANKIEFKDIFLKNFERNIIFNIDGSVEISKKTRKKGKKKYQFNYNVGGNSFKFSNCLSGKNRLLIEEYNQFSEINIGYINIKYLKEIGATIYKYKLPIDGNCSVETIISVDEYNNINKCYIDFRILKNNHKTKGIYALRIDKVNDCYKLNFLSRSGSRQFSIFSKLKDYDRNFYFQVINDSLTPNLLDELIVKLIPIINKDLADKYCVSLAHPEINPISCMFNSRKYVIEYLEKIKNEIPLPHLYNIINSFIDKQKYHLNNNSQTSKKLLKSRKN